MSEITITGGTVAGRESAAMERALQRIRDGQTAYAAAKAEGLAVPSIYRALNRPKNADVKAIHDARQAKK